MSDETPRARRQLPFSWRTLGVSTALALLAAIATVAILADDDADDAPEGPGITLVPDDDGVTFTTFDGETVDLASLRGGPVVLNFFASTCVPCIAEMPAFEQVHQELGDEVTFLGLAAFGDQPKDALDLVERTGVTYRTARDDQGAVMAELGGTMLPTTFLLDADGAAVASHAGEMSAGELRDLIADELGIGT